MPADGGIRFGNYCSCGASRAGVWAEVFLAQQRGLVSLATALQGFIKNIAGAGDADAGRRMGPLTAPARVADRPQQAIGYGGAWPSGSSTTATGSSSSGAARSPPTTRS